MTNQLPPSSDQIIEAISNLNVHEAQGLLALFMGGMYQHLPAPQVEDNFWYYLAQIRDEVNDGTAFGRGPND